MIRIIITFLLINSLSLLNLKGQNYINPKTNVYFQFKNMLSDDIYQYDLIAKIDDNLPSIKMVTVTKEKKENFIDSLSKTGFTDKFDLFDVSKNFRYNFLISNYKYFMTNNNKEVVYKVSITIKLTMRGSDERTISCGEYTTKKTQYEISKQLKSITTNFRRLDKSNIYFFKFHADSFFDIPMYGAKQTSPIVTTVYF